MRKKFFLMAFVLLTLVLAGCSRFGGQEDPKDRYYYEGYEGVRTEFANSRDSPPRRLYYYGDTEDNRFTISAQVENVGSSLSRGGLYLSGYDPNMIHVRGITPRRTGGACSFNLAGIFQQRTGLISAECLGISGDVRIGEGDLEFVGGDLNFNEFMDSIGVDENAGLREFVRQARISYDRTESGNSSWGIELGTEYGSLNIDTIKRGRLLISALAPIDFTRNFGKSYVLRGDTPEYPGGDTAVINWDANIEDFPIGRDEVRQSFMITNCHLYTTHAAPQICIDPSPYSENERSCVPSNYNPTNGQGAPVAVTSIEQENTPRKVIFTINVKNKGDGEVWNPGSLEKCSPYQTSRVRSSDKNKIWLGLIRVSGSTQPMECNRNNFIRLDDRTESGSITCTYDIPFQGMQSAYETPIVVELWYGYRNTIRRDVTIKRAI